VGVSVVVSLLIQEQNVEMIVIDGETVPKLPFLVQYWNEKNSTWVTFDRNSSQEAADENIEWWCGRKHLVSSTYQT
jgi:hypothetical protein